MDSKGSNSNTTSKDNHTSNNQILGTNSLVTNREAINKEPMEITFHIIIKDQFLAKVTDSHLMDKETIKEIIYKIMQSIQLFQIMQMLILN